MPRARDFPRGSQKHGSHTLLQCDGQPLFEIHDGSSTMLSCRSISLHEAAKFLAPSATTFEDCRQKAWPRVSPVFGRLAIQFSLFISPCSYLCCNPYISIPSLLIPYPQHNIT